MSEDKYLEVVSNNFPYFYDGYEHCNECSHDIDEYLKKWSQDMEKTTYCFICYELEDVITVEYLNRCMDRLKFFNVKLGLEVLQYPCRKFSGCVCY